MTFTDYCLQNNLELLPEDLTFIRRQLKHIPKTRQKAVMRRYVEIWINTRDECESPVRAQNLGRRAANSFLLTLND